MRFRKTSDDERHKPNVVGVSTRKGLMQAIVAILVVAMALAMATTARSTETKRNAATPPGLATAKKELEPFLAAPRSIGITTPLSRLPKGKTVAYLECSVVNCKIHAAALKEAFSHLGVKLKLVSSGDSPESFSNALKTVASLKPDGVILDAIPAALAQPAVDQMAKNGTVIVGIAAPTLKLGKNVGNVLGRSWWRAMGQAQANWVIVKSRGAAKVLYVQDTALDFSPLLSAGVHAAFKRNCPTCEVGVVKTNPTEIGTKIPGLVTSYLQQHPDTTYVIGGFSALLIGVPAVLQTAGIDGVKLIGFAPTAINEGYLKAGQEAAELEQSNTALSWFAADAVARGMVGDPFPRTIAFPPLHQIITKVTFNPNTEYWPYIPGWKQQFIRLWKDR